MKLLPGFTRAQFMYTNMLILSNNFSLLKKCYIATFIRFCFIFIQRSHTRIIYILFVSSQSLNKIKVLMCEHRLYMVCVLSSTHSVYTNLDETKNLHNYSAYWASHPARSGEILKCVQDKSSVVYYLSRAPLPLIHKAGENFPCDGKIQEPVRYCG